eukprot:SAG22_NODE_1217_length_5138_cov_6.636039_4_plen_336_part_00
MRSCTTHSDVRKMRKYTVFLQNAARQQTAYAVGSDEAEITANPDLAKVEAVLEAAEIKGAKAWQRGESHFEALNGACVRSCRPSGASSCRPSGASSVGRPSVPIAALEIPNVPYADSCLPCLAGRTNKHTCYLLGHPVDDQLQVYASTYWYWGCVTLVVMRDEATTTTPTPTPTAVFPFLSCPVLSCPLHFLPSGGSCSVAVTRGATALTADRVLLSLPVLVSFLVSFLPLPASSYVIYGEKVMLVATTVWYEDPDCTVPLQGPPACTASLGAVLATLGLFTLLTVACRWVHAAAVLSDKRCWPWPWPWPFLPFLFSTLVRSFVLAGWLQNFTAG